MHGQRPDISDLGTSALDATDPVDPGSTGTPRDPQRLIDDARRAGITQFQVVAVIRPDTEDRVVLLLDHRHDDIWALPVAWVRPTETVAHTLDWLCDEHLGLAQWRAQCVGTATYESADGSEILQLAFDVAVPPDSPLAWSGRCQWWHVHTEPPTLHRLARPLMRQLHSPEPEPGQEPGQEPEPVVPAE
ncbi:hypothetical protein SAMN05414137_106125 [Streptacidiphilus jiangxiensis]|uniref:NUDIX domain-containing protein n=2 Tax=Streptacidiphilus jiangxiensis TaxID=235985 RepID=A0A1H7MYR6_STRJI|nr:hypothetical protein SAMN05414137_106125 [Streptacidiphilus jiangxiensis]